MWSVRSSTVGALITLVSVVGAAVMAHQQEPDIYSPQQLSSSPEEFDAAMKATGLAFELVQRALKKNDVGDAKDFLSRSRELLTTTIVFWRQRKEDDAVKMLRTALKAMDDLDASLSAGSDDTTVRNLGVTRVAAACEACHEVYREQDPATKDYRLKAGSVE